MNIVRGFGIALKAQFQAIPFIWKNRLWPYYFFPLALFILLFVGLYSVTSEASEWVEIELIQWVESFFTSENLGWLKSTLYVITFIILRILLFLVFAYLGGYVVLIFLSPVLAILSERTEKILNGKTFPFSINQLLKDIVRGVLLALRNLSLELFATAILFGLSFVPIVGFLTPVIGIVLTAYFYGFSFIDYTHERYKFTTSQSIRYIRRNSGLSIGSGLVFSVLLMIPFIGSLLAGFAAINSTVAATIARLQYSE